MCNYSDIMMVYQNQIGIMDSLWNFFSGGCFAAIGALSISAIKNSPKAILVVIIAFSIFADANYNSIKRSQPVLIKLAKKVNDFAKEENKVIEKKNKKRNEENQLSEYPLVKENKETDVLLFHKKIDALVLIFLCSYALYVKYKKDPQQLQEVQT